MARGGKRPGAGRPKGSTRERKAGKQLATQVTLPEGDALKRAIDALGENFGAHDLMRAIYRAKEAPLDARFTAASKALPFEAAKPTSNKAQSGGITFTFKRHVST